MIHFYGSSISCTNFFLRPKIYREQYVKKILRSLYSVLQTIKVLVNFSLRITQVRFYPWKGIWLITSLIYSIFRAAFSKGGRFWTTGLLQAFLWRMTKPHNRVSPHNGSINALLLTSKKIKCSLFTKILLWGVLIYYIVVNEMIVYVLARGMYRMNNEGLHSKCVWSGKVLQLGTKF